MSGVELVGCKCRLRMVNSGRPEYLDLFVYKRPLESILNMLAASVLSV